MAIENRPDYGYQIITEEFNGTYHPNGDKQVPNMNYTAKQYVNGRTEIVGVFLTKGAAEWCLGCLDFVAKSRIDRAAYKKG